MTPVDSSTVAASKCPSGPMIGIAMVSLVAVLWAYQPSLGGDFFRDDFIWVRQAHDAAIGHQHWDFAVGRAFRPLTNLFFIAMWSVFRESPFPYHSVSLCLHVMVSLLVVCLCYYFYRSHMAAIWGGISFALLASPSSAVMWVCSVADLIVVCFSVFAIIFSSKYGREGRLSHGLLALTSFGLALGAKEVAIGLFPLITLVVCFTPGIAPSVKVRRLLGVAGGLAAIFAAYLAWRTYQDVPAEGYGSELLKAPFFVIVGLFKILLPSEMVNWAVNWIGMDPNKETWPIGIIAAVGITCLVMVVFSLRWFGRVAAKEGHTYWWLIFAWPVAFLVPPSFVVEGSGITPVSHLLYLPAVGVALGISLATVLLCRASVRIAWRWTALVCLIGYSVVNLAIIHSRSQLWQQMGEQTRAARAVILDHARELHEAQARQHSVVAVRPPLSMKNDVGRLVNYWLGLKLNVHETMEMPPVDQTAQGKVLLHLQGHPLGRDLD